MNTNGKNLPILLVEDNPTDVELTLRAFKKRKLTNPIIVARDGEEAMEQITLWEKGSQAPVIVLLDLKLPKVDGLEVLKKIKSHPVFNTIPVVVLTSSAEDKDIEAAYKLGTNSYIVKPVDFNKFIEVATQIELYWTVFNKPFLP
jgi:CheY-like chemotaxis protein